MGDSTLSDGSGNYAFIVTVEWELYRNPQQGHPHTWPDGIDTADLVAIQRHFLEVGLLTGCRLTAADVNNDLSVDTLDVIAVQRFFIGLSTGIANTGSFSSIRRNGPTPLW